jgi:hypothetical protein
VPLKPTSTKSFFFQISTRNLNFPGPVRPAIFALDQQTSVNYPNQLSFKIDQGFHINYLIKLQVFCFDISNKLLVDQTFYDIKCTYNSKTKKLASFH